MKKVHYAILTGEALSYALIVVFIFADAMFDLTGVFRSDGITISPQFAYIAACLVAVVGCINVWLTWYYIQKANAVRDWLVICAWTHRVKQHGRWISLEEFLTGQLGYQVSHGLSDASIVRLRDEIDAKWRQFPAPPAGAADAASETLPAPDDAGSPAAPARRARGEA
jgi:hypothetical protein